MMATKTATGIERRRTGYILGPLIGKRKVLVARSHAINTQPTSRGFVLDAGF
jgi:hypothetical protein